MEHRADELGVARYDPELRRHVHLAERLRQDELTELARVYHEIRRRDDNDGILDWITEARPSGPAGEVAARSIQLLLVVLQQLGQLGVKPFSEKLILAEKPPDPLDWTILPAELTYLGRSVERYAKLSTESAILEWLDQATHTELDELNELARKMFRDEELILAWADQHHGTREEFRVNWMYLLFDHAGIEPE